MKHPFLGSFATVYYCLIWVFVGVGHYSILYFHFEVSLVSAILDSLVFNTLFACMGLGYWYLTRFSIPRNITDNRKLLTLPGSGIVAVFLWIWISTSILHLIQPDKAYQQFLDDSLIWRIIFGAFYFTFIVMVYYVIYYNRNLQEQENRQLQLATEVKEAELRMLKSQINPHFIFNSLNSVSSLTISDPPKAQQMIINLSSFLRYSIGKDNKETNLLRTELENIELYLSIEKVRFGDRLHFHKEVPEECYQSKIPNLLLQPLFENAIKHGVQESIEPIYINFSTHLTNNSLVISISNNFDQEAVSNKGTGIGLKNIKQRLALLYGTEDFLQYSIKENLFEVSLEIPQ